MDSKSYNSLSSLTIFSIIMSFGWLTFGMIYVTLNGTSAQVAYSLEWPSDQVESIITWSSSLILLGLAVASGFGSKFLPMVSRRSSLLLADIFIIVGSCCHMSKNISVFLTGRMMLGVGMGLNYLVIPIYIREMSPAEISGKLGSFNKICYSSGNFIAFALVIGLSAIPDEREYWKMIYLMPVAFSVIRFILICTVYKYDSPKYYFSINQPEKAKLVIEQIYCPELHEKIFDVLSSQTKSAHNIKTKELIVDYKKQFLICVLTVSIYQLSGLNAINFYSTRILLDGDTSTKNIVGARFVNLGIGGLRIIANLLGSTLLDRLGRKTLYIAGGAAIGISMALLSLSLFYDISFLSKISVLAFCFSMASSISLTNPIYVAECLPFKGCGYVGIVDNVLAFFVVLTFPTLSDWLGTEYVTLMFVFLIIAHIIELKINVVETKGLTMEEIFEKFKNMSKPARKISISNGEQVHENKAT